MTSVNSRSDNDLCTGSENYLQEGQRKTSVYVGSENDLCMGPKNDFCTGSENDFSMGSKQDL